MSQVRYRVLGIHIRLDVDANQFASQWLELPRADQVLSFQQILYQQVAARGHLLG